MLPFFLPIRGGRKVSPSLRNPPKVAESHPESSRFQPRMRGILSELSRDGLSLSRKFLGFSVATRTSIEDRWQAFRYVDHCREPADLSILATSSNHQEAG